MAKDCARNSCTTAQAQTLANLNADDGKRPSTRCAGPDRARGARVVAPTVPPERRTCKVHQHCQRRIQPPPGRLRVSTVSHLVDPGHSANIGARSGQAPWPRTAHPAARPASHRIFSLCEYREICAVVGRKAENEPPFTGVESSSPSHGDTTVAGSCGGEPAGANLPGGFGWLSPSAGCKVVLTAAGSVASSTGNPAPSCVDMNALRNTAVLLPMYDGDSGTGSGGSYHIAGFAGFYLTGYRFPGDKWPNGINSRAAEASVASRVISRRSNDRHHVRRPRHGRHDLQDGRLTRNRKNRDAFDRGGRRRAESRSVTP